MMALVYLFHVFGVMLILAALVVTACDLSAEAKQVRRLQARINELGSHRLTDRKDVYK